MLAAVDLRPLVGLLFVLFSFIAGCYLARFPVPHSVNEAENEGTGVDVLECDS